MSKYAKIKINGNDCSGSNSQYIKDNISDITKYSITPETFKERCFKSDQDVIFEDEYSFNGKHHNSFVRRYGIDRFKLPVSMDANQNVIIGNELISIGNAQGSNSSFGSKYISDRSFEVKVYNNEMDALLNAIDYLLNTTCTQKTVLVDIFNRNICVEANSIKEQRIKTEGTNQKYPETHTILLFRQPDNKIFVIDPNNAQYSLHVTSKNNSINTKLQEFKNPNLPLKTAYSNIALYINQSGMPEIETINMVKSTDKIQIYNSSKKKGASNGDARDCVDIAVKLAFLLEEHSGALPKDSNALSNINEIQYVSNSASINKYTPPDVLKETLRIQHKSNIKVIQDLHFLYLKIKSILDKLQEFGQGAKLEQNKLQNELSTILTKDANDSNTLKGQLKSLHDLANGGYNHFIDDVIKKLDNLKISGSVSNFDPADYD